MKAVAQPNRPSVDIVSDEVPADPSAGTALMRILMVSHFFESHGGGIERVAGQLCREFSMLGAATAWAASNCDPAPAAPFEAIPLQCVNPIEKMTGLPMPIPGFGAARQLWLAVRRSDAVVVHDSLYVTSILALVFAKLMGRPVIIMQHIAAIPFASPLLRTMMKMANLLITGAMLRWADRCVFISDTVRQELGGERFGELLFNGVDHAIFNRGATSKRGPRPLTEAEQTTAKRRLLFVGRYVEKKGMAILRSLARLRPDDTLFLAGSGPIRPQEWGLSNVVDLGPKGPTELAALYRSADVLILPSVGEGFPLVIQEAMACGLPVVCGSPAHRADPGAAQWLRGVHIDLSDAEGSAARCAAAIDLKMLDIERAEMADYACERYNWTASAQRLLDLARRQALPA